MSRTHEERELSDLKLAVLKGICLGVGLITLLSGIVNWLIANKPLLSTLQLSYTVLAMLSLYGMRGGELRSTLVAANLLGLMLVLFYGVWVSTPGSGLFYAAFLVPMLFYVFLPLREAAWVSGLSGALMLTVLWWQLGRSPNFMLYNFAVVYLMFWVVGATYERSRRRIHQRLEFNMLHDVLTAAGNRQALSRDFAHFAGIGPGQALMLDIDYFKQVNDNHGHQAGDAVICHLVSTARQLHDAARIYRIGGEEFLLLCPGLNQPQGLALAEALRQQVAQQPCPHQGQQLGCTVSIGVASWVAGGALERLLHQADAALYAAKRGGRNRVCVAED